MQNLLLFLSACPAVAWAVIAVLFLIVRRRGRSLSSCAGPACNGEALPRVSIVVAACNEAETIQPALSSLLSVDYPDFEVIVVQDRSTDRTAEMLDEMAEKCERLRVVSIDSLPSGWLGKTHALYRGAAVATGELLLFTDADVHFSRGAVAGAVRLTLQRKLDHLVVYPTIVTHGVCERAYVCLFGVLFTLWARPWQVSNPRSTAYIGIGAFNLVRAAAYHHAGGHEAIRMDVCDDMKLGKALKRSGASQECVASGGLVRLEWMAGWRGIFKVTQKNMFAGMNYRMVEVVRSTIAVLGLAVWPAFGLLTGPPVGRVLSVAAFAGMASVLRIGRPAQVMSPLCALTLPLGGALFVAALFNSVASTYRNGGVVWRGTRYPMAELRRGIV